MLKVVDNRVQHWLRVTNLKQTGILAEQGQTAQRSEVLGYISSCAATLQRIIEFITRLRVTLLVTNFNGLIVFLLRFIVHIDQNFLNNHFIFPILLLHLHQELKSRSCNIRPNQIVLQCRIKILDYPFFYPFTLQSVRRIYEKKNCLP